jgi:hypothetical protein
MNLGNFAKTINSIANSKPVNTTINVVVTIGFDKRTATVPVTNILINDDLTLSLACEVPNIDAFKAINTPLKPPIEEKLTEKIEEMPKNEE